MSIRHKPLLALALISAALLLPTTGHAQPPGVEDDPAIIGAGQKEFANKCERCHDDGTAPDRRAYGPNLRGVVGRKAGSWDHFKYTDAMRKSGHVWNAKLLDQYLENPYSLVPGAAMGLLVPVEKNRADVIAYLASNPEELKQTERAP